MRLGVDASAFHRAVSRPPRIPASKGGSGSATIAADSKLAFCGAAPTINGLEPEAEVSNGDVCDTVCKRESMASTATPDNDQFGSDLNVCGQSCINTLDYDLQDDDVPDYELPDDADDCELRGVHGGAHDELLDDPAPRREVSPNFDLSDSDEDTHNTGSREFFHWNVTKSISDQGPSGAADKQYVGSTRSFAPTSNRLLFMARLNSV